MSNVTTFDSNKELYCFMFERYVLSSKNWEIKFLVLNPTKDQVKKGIIVLVFGFWTISSRVKCIASICLGNYVLKQTKRR